MVESEECEELLESNEYCFDISGWNICVDWAKILWAVVIMNFLQFVFEASMYLALETSLRPTPLQRLEDEELDAEEIDQVN